MQMTIWFGRESCHKTLMFPRSQIISYNSAYKIFCRNIRWVFLTHLFEGDRSLSVYLTDDEEIRQFNLKQRGMDRPTDILSWSYYEEDPELEWVGDLILSLPRVQLQAEENGWDLRTELVRMLAHGCAHLAGWDHEGSVEEAEAMLKCEKLMLEKAGFEKIYYE